MLKSTRKWRFVVFLLVSIVAASCAGPGPTPAPDVQRLGVFDHCETLKAFADGGVLQYCPPPGEPTGYPGPATDVPAPTDTDTPVPEGEPTVEPSATDTSEPATATPKPSGTPTDSPATATVTSSATVVASDTPAPTDTPTAVPSATVAPIPPTVTLVPPTATTGAAVAPYPSAPLCADHGAEHDTSLFHTLWDAQRGCHYDHEHGTSPFTGDIAAVFPGFDLLGLLGNVGVGHTNPSSPVENTHKHGGMKWQVQVPAPKGCAVGFEGGTVAVDALAVQYHAFGDPAIEAEVRIHSTVALLRQCKPGSPNDKGYVFINQLQDYGQRIVPYQGTLVGYPNQPQPAYDTPRGPYLSLDCIGPVAQCRSSLAQAQSNNANSIWTSKVTGQGHSDTPALFRLLFRLRDMYRLFDWNDQVHPFTFLWLCTTDGGSEYNPAGCRYNNTTTRIHEVAGVLPVAWDNLSGWDTEPQVGRLTVDGFIDQNGQPTAVCQAPGVQCYPIKLVRAFTGFYSSELTAGKCSNTTVVCNPERDIYFSNGQVVSETAPGAVPSGWVGPAN